MPPHPPFTRTAGGLGLALAGTLLATWLGVQDPSPAPPPRQDPLPGVQEPDAPIGVLGFRPSQRKLLEEGLLGTWRLERFVHPEQPIAEGDVVGAALFARDTLSIQIHIRTLRPFATGPDFYVQAGIHYWRIDEQLRLSTATVIGHSDLAGPMTYEPAFQPREFEVTLDLDSMSLTRPDGARLEFSRIDVEGFPEQALRALEDARANKPRPR